MRALVAVALLLLFAAPLAHAAAALAPDPHACCPERPAPANPAPCQQLAMSACCAELGVPATPAGADDVAPPLLALTASQSAAPAPARPYLRAPLTRSDGPPLPPLARSGALLL